MEKLSLQNDIKNFLYHCEFALGKTENTIKSLKVDLTSFNEYIENCKDLEEIRDIEPFNIREFLSKLQNENIGKRSINRKLSSLKGFFKYLIKEKKIEKNPTLTVVAPSYTRGVPDALTLEEIRRMRDVISLKNYKGVRDRLILELLYSSGMTSQELLGLGEDVFNIDEREVIVTSFKKSRKIYFSERARKYLKKYIEMKKEKFKENYKKEILIVNNSGKRLNDRSLRRIMTQYSEKAGITEKEVTPHAIRHTFAVHMLERGMKLNQLQKLLGHSSLETSKMYLEAVKKKKKRDEIKILQRINIE